MKTNYQIILQMKSKFITRKVGNLWKLYKFFENNLQFLAQKISYLRAKWKFC